jgi:transcriptional regulator with XRE-family HTH domain
MYKPEQSKQFGGNLKQLLEKRKLSHRQFAQQSGLEPSYVSKLVNGKIAEPRQATLRKIAKGLGLKTPEEVWSEIQPLNSSAPEKIKPETLTILCPETSGIDELVQSVRSRLHDDIQQLHGTMPLWGVDHWVPLDDLFVDVNILGELNSSHRIELDDLWQNFTTGIQKSSRYRSLDRIGLGTEQKRLSGQAALFKNTNLILVGKPGSGKTTYLQRVVTKCNTGKLESHRIPGLIKLRDFVDDGQSFSYSLEYFLEQFWQLSTEETQLVLSQGRLLLLLDGLDEITGEDGKTITKEIKRFARSYPQTRIIATCRTQSFLGTSDWKSLRFSFIEIADFNEAQVRSFAKHWFKTVMQNEVSGLEKSKEFLEKLFQEENKPIRELAITPILLSLTCVVFLKTEKFYSKHSRLYEEGLELLLEQWDKSREIKRDKLYKQLSVERKLELLSYLAAKKINQEQYILFEQTEIEGYIADFLGVRKQDGEIVLRSIEDQHGLLIRRSQKIWSFSHLTFQEYLAAKWFCKQADWGKLFSQLLNKNWREIFILAIEISPDFETILLLMKQSIDQLISSDHKIQDFTVCINKKSESVVSSYISSAIRAFYFFLPCEVTTHIFEEYTVCGGAGYEGMIIAHQHLACALDKSLGQALTSGNKIKFNLCNDLLLDLSLSNILVLLESHSLNISGSNSGLTFNIISNLKGKDEWWNHYDFSWLMDFSPDEETKRFIREFEDELPGLDGSGTREHPHRFTSQSDWMRANGFHWANRLREILVKNRNIGHDWSFSETQKQLLQKYYDANRLLVSCLNIACSSNHVVRTIKDKLLLPITEIEKHEREREE